MDPQKVKCYLGSYWVSLEEHFGCFIILFSKACERLFKLLHHIVSLVAAGQGAMMVVGVPLYRGSMNFSKVVRYLTSLQ